MWNARSQQWLSWHSCLIEYATLYLCIATVTLHVRPWCIRRVLKEACKLLLFALLLILPSNSLLTLLPPCSPGLLLLASLFKSCSSFEPVGFTNLRAMHYHILIVYQILPSFRFTYRARTPQTLLLLQSMRSASTLRAARRGGLVLAYPADPLPTARQRPTTRLPPRSQVSGGLHSITTSPAGC